MTEQTPIPPPLPESFTPPAAPTQNGTDIEMKDSTDTLAIDPALATQNPTQPVPVSTPTHQQTAGPSAPTPTPAPPTSTSTPTRNSPHPSAPPPSAPTHPNPHGSPTRVYLNQNVTPHLLEAMKHLVTAEPDKPLKWLSEFLAQKSLEIEGP
ncbi:hypothetical protein BCR34DRAFT_552037 [Clohesyomyces aquaticus]|uniref:Dpy-30 motif-domain-containing protein n=1 Tax=Clohesyomyces aquaticus TaxID=1231657 RepID=A0A1Y2AAV7_9PLEO|nr:hypothetical protein BCR34DRAFT_552037 [Clohesyomyces aquaticus]